MKWKRDVNAQSDGTVHVWPESEEREHVLHGTGCECSPQVKQYAAAILVVHHSYRITAQRRKKPS